MEKWTAETEQALEDYLSEVEHCAWNKGDEAAEIVSGLREHIINETEEVAGEVVTLDHLRRILAAVGTPESVIGVEEKSSDEAEMDSESKASTIPPPMAKPDHAKPPRNRSCGCLAVAIILGVPVAIVVVVIGILLGFRVTSQVETSKISLINRTHEGLYTLAQLEEDFKDVRIRDDNEDGVGDYGSLVELKEFNSNAVQIATQRSAYLFTIKVSPGTNLTDPTFVIVASPTSAYLDEDLPVLRIDQTGEVTSSQMPPAVELATMQNMTNEVTPQNKSVESRTIADLNLIARAQEAFRRGTFLDKNADGEGDYGTLKQLSSSPASLLPAEFMPGNPTHSGIVLYEYDYRMVAANGTADEEPSFFCIATPKSESMGFRSFFVDQTGVIRYAEDGVPIGENSEVLYSTEQGEIEAADFDDAP